MSVVEIRNDGPRVLASNYWLSQAARDGHAYLSANAGAWRLLVPANWRHRDDARAAMGAAVTRAPWPQAGRGDAVEVLFDDGSDAPLALHLGLESVERLPPGDDPAERRLLVYAPGPRLILDLPCRYRRGEALPDLRAWDVADEAPTGPAPVVEIAEGPVAGMFLSINHYISTGDHMGEGSAIEGADGNTIFGVPVRTGDPEDEANFRKLSARIDQLRETGRTTAHMEDLGRGGPFRHWGLRVRPEEVETLSAALREAPGPLGWGTCKAVVDAHRWSER